MKRLTFAIIIVLFLMSLPVVVLGAPSPTPSATPIATPTTTPDTGGFFSGLSDVVNSIIDLPSRLVENALQRVSDLIYKGMSSTIINNLRFYLGAFSDFMRGGDSHIFNDPTIRAINTVMCPVAYSIMIILFFLGLTKATMNLELISTEVALRFGILLVIARLFVDKSGWLLQQICAANTYLTTKILDITSSSMDNLYNVSQGWSNGMAPATTLDTQLGLSFVFILFAFIALLCAIAMFVILILRQIHIAVMVCAAPLFFATMVSDVGNHVFKSYLMHFIASVFQTTFMAVAVAIFSGSIKSYLSGTALGIGGGFVGMMVGIIGLSFYIVKMPSTINSILGAHGGNGGMNIASIAGLFARV